MHTMSEEGLWTTTYIGKCAGRRRGTNRKNRKMIGKGTEVQSNGCSCGPRTTRSRYLKKTTTTTTTKHGESEISRSSSKAMLREHFTNVCAAMAGGPVTKRSW